MADTDLVEDAAQAVVEQTQASVAAIQAEEAADTAAEAAQDAVESAQELRQELTEIAAEEAAELEATVIETEQRVEGLTEWQAELSRRLIADNSELREAISTVQTSMLLMQEAMSTLLVSPPSQPETVIVESPPSVEEADPLEVAANQEQLEVKKKKIRLI